MVRNDCIEVFPVGGLIYITEEVFEKKPQLALKLIQLFCAKVARLRDQKSVGNEADDADLLWRLCVRPELMAHLLKYCEDHEKELEAGDADMQRFVQRVHIQIGTHTKQILVAPNYILFWPRLVTLSKMTQLLH